MTKPAIGDDCSRCGGRIGVLDTRVSGAWRTRWLGCHDCGFRPPDNKQIVPLEHAPRQRRRMKRKNFRRRAA